ncbi:MAG TPA: hypothetical protein VFQ65_27525, partial [Kofleriaceae bacterium]|nr:hypothetical protein [Kofleriaceae bacterium]
TSAEDAAALAEAARAGLQAGLDETTFAAETQSAAFSGWCTILSHGKAGGVLDLQLTVADKGNTGGKFFESAAITGITDKLAGIMAGRPLASYRMPIKIGASYFTSKPAVGSDGDEGDNTTTISRDFVVNVSEAGAATAGSQDPWLLARGNGNANAGAASLYQELLGVAVPLNV